MMRPTGSLSLYDH